MGLVIIMCGISGSGKSTRAAKFYPEAVVVSTDHYFMKNDEYKFDPSLLPSAHGTCLRKFVAELCYKKSLIVVDNTNTTVAEVAPYAALALAYEYDFRIEILKVDVEIAAARNPHGVPKAGIMKMAARLKTLKNSLPSWWPREEIQMDTEKKVDFKQYLNLVSLAQVRNRIWRPGQVYFNVLSELRPDISEEIRGSRLDPFYRDERIAEFLSFVADKW